MTPRRPPGQNSVTLPEGAARPPYRWLLFVHQLPSRPSNLRVRTWRRLQQIGALAVKQALYVLPDTPSSREDFEWIKTEVEGAGGQANVFAAADVDTWSNDALVEEFRRSRLAKYEALAHEAERLLKRKAIRANATSQRRATQELKERLSAVEQIDFFGSPGRDRVAALVHELEGRARATPEGEAPKDATRGNYRGRLWVTRPRPGVDRMASAWLIRRFIDHEARFAFAADRAAIASDAVAFDMFGVEFTHRGQLCTFETLCDVFAVQEPAVRTLGELVHDLDLKDARFGHGDTRTMGHLIEGLRLSHPDDLRLLEAGITLFEAFYQASSRAHGLQKSQRTRATGKGRAKSAQRKRR